MSYHEVLNRIIEDSGLTLKQISDKCELLGVHVAPSYLSKLKTNKQAPASDHINNTIAKVCDADPQELLFEAYMEKAPDFIKSVINKLADQARTVAKIQFEDNNGPLFDVMKNQILSLSDYFIITSFLEQSIDEQMFIESNNLLTNKFDTLQIVDDSMFPTIPEGARIKIDTINEVTNGDILYVELNNVFMVRRYFENDNLVYLIADNSKFESKIFNKSEINVIGKVISFEVSV